MKDELLEKLRFWHPPPAHLSQEHAFFREKIAPLIPEIIDNLESRAREIAELEQRIKQTVLAKDREIETRNARIGRYESEIHELREKMDRQQPEIDRLKRQITEASAVLRVGSR